MAWNSEFGGSDTIDDSECHDINSAGRGVRVRCMQRNGAVGGRDICDCVRAEGRGGLECPVVGVEISGWKGAA